MSDTDKGFTIGIKTKADLAGGAAAEKQLVQLKQKTEELTAATSKLTAEQEKQSNAAYHAADKQQAADLLELASVQRAAAARKKAATPELNIKEDVETTAGDFLKSISTSNANNLSKPSTFTAAAKDIGQAAGVARKNIAGMGTAIRNTARMLGLPAIRGGAALLTALGGASAVAYVAFSRLSEVIKKIGDVDTPKLQSLVDMQENIREKTDQLQLATESYYRELQRIQDMPETEAAKAEFKKKIIEDVARFTVEMDDAATHHALANIENLEKTGLIDHEEALRRKYAADQEYQQKKTALEKSQLDAGIKVKGDQLTEDYRLQANFRNPLKTAEDAQRGTTATLETETEKLNQAKKLREDTRDAIAKYEKDIADAQAGIAGNQKVFGLAPGSPGDKTINALNYANLSIAQGGQRGEQGTLDKLGIDIPKQQKLVYAAEDANNRATESLMNLREQVDALAKDINRLTIELPQDIKAAQAKKDELDQAAAAATQAKHDDLVSTQLAKEQAAGIGIGAAGSQLRYNPASAMEWNRLSNAQRKSGTSPLPTVEYDPNKRDARTGLPNDPAQPRDLQPWEAGAQKQYNERRFPGYSFDDNGALTGSLTQAHGESTAAQQNAVKVAEAVKASNKIVSDLLKQLIGVVEKHGQDISDHSSQIQNVFNR